MNTPEQLTHKDCLNYNATSLDKQCEGNVEYRHPLSGTGRPFPRCDKHWQERLDQQAEIDRKYAPNSDVAPADFDPTYAGEQWDED